MTQSPWKNEAEVAAKEMTPVDHMNVSGRELARRITNTSIDVANRFPPDQQSSIQLAFTCNLISVMVRSVAQAKGHFEMAPLREQLIAEIEEFVVDDDE